MSTGYHPVHKNEAVLASTATSTAQRSMDNTIRFAQPHQMHGNLAPRFCIDTPSGFRLLVRGNNLEVRVNRVFYIACNINANGTRVA